MKLGFSIKAKGLSGLNKPTASTRKPIFDEDDDEAAESGKLVNRREEVGNFDFDGFSNSKAEPKKSKPSSKPKGPLTEPPFLKSKPRKDDPTLQGKSASTLEAEQKAMEAMNAKLHRSTCVKKPMQRMNYDSYLAHHHAYMASVVQVLEPTCFEKFIGKELGESHE